MKRLPTLMAIMIAVASPLYSQAPPADQAFAKECLGFNKASRSEGGASKWTVSVCKNLQLRGSQAVLLKFDPEALKKCQISEQAILRLTVKKLPIKEGTTDGSIEIRLNRVEDSDYDPEGNVMLSNEFSKLGGGLASLTKTAAELGPGSLIEIPISISSFGGPEGLQRGILIMISDAENPYFGKNILGLDCEGLAAGASAPSLVKAP
jgi:hypothetical protein